MIKFLHTNEFSLIENLCLEAEEYAGRLRKENPDLFYVIDKTNYHKSNRVIGWWGCGN